MKRDLELEKEWRNRFEEYKMSGLSVNTWSKKNGLKPTTFRYWIKRFSSTEQKVSPAKVQFAKVVLESDSSNNIVKSTTGENKKAFSKADVAKEMQIQSSDFQVFFNNIRVTVPSNFSPTALSGLIKVLKTL